MGDSEISLKTYTQKLEARIAQLEASAPSDQDQALYESSVKTAQEAISALCKKDETLENLLLSTLLDYPEFLSEAEDMPLAQQSATPEAKLNIVSAQRSSIYTAQRNSAQLAKMAPEMPSLEQSQQLAGQLTTLRSLQERVKSQEVQVDKLAQQTESLLLSWYEGDVRSINQALSHLGLDKLSAEIADLPRRAPTY